MDESLDIISGQQESAYPASVTDKQSHAEQVALLYRNAPFAYVITIMCAALLCWVQRAFISTEILLVWLLCVCSLTVVRSMLVLGFYRACPNLNDASRWGHYYLITTVFSGLLWGSAAIFLFPAESLAHQGVVAVVLSGISAGAVPMLASIREVFLVFMWLTLTPLALRLFAVGHELTIILGILTIFFVMGMLISSQRLNRSIVRSLNLRFQNEALFKNLERDKAEADRLNCVLLTQIDERERVEQALRTREAELHDLTDQLEQRVTARTRELQVEIEERKRAENNLRLRSRALEQSGSMVLITDRANIIEYVNPHILDMTGYTQNELLANNVQMLDYPADECGFSEMLAETLRIGRNWRGELRIRKKGGKSYWSLLSISPMQEEDHRTTHLVVVGEDLTQIKDNQARMEQLAFYDTLTGLANRRLFKDRLEQALVSVRREHKALALLQLDVDHFKRINDTLGHDAGDYLLQTVARRLIACVRQQDTVARLGGDEFIVLLTKIDEARDAGQVADKIISSLRQPIRLPTQEVIITISLGITVAPDDGHETHKLMKHVDLALYRAKQQGRNTYRFFVEDMNRQALQRLTLEYELHQALEQERFTIHYQPVVHLVDRHVVDLEALVRWHHPELGLVAPDQFIKVAEQTGLILPLGEWILSQVCRDQALLRNAYPELGRVMVNLSSRQFLDPSLLQFLARLFTETGCDAKWLGLEITEELLMKESKKGLKVLTLLQDLGIALSIDNFGKGYSSLSYLKQLPIDSLKIDRSFAGNIAENVHNQSITSALIALGQKLGFQVLAEGIETYAHLAFLQKNDCHYGQGFLFGPPMPLTETLSFLSKRPKLPKEPTESQMI
jgi:diguanylate cyclase (GGDEF)-like protein/PAS domain S-box-containing protein